MDLLQEKFCFPTEQQFICEKRGAVILLLFPYFALSFYSTTIRNTQNAISVVCHLSVMCHHHNRLMILLRSTGQHLCHILCILSIQIAAGLIRKNDCRLRNQCPCNRNSLLLPYFPVFRQYAAAGQHFHRK